MRDYSLYLKRNTNPRPKSVFKTLKISLFLLLITAAIYLYPTIIQPLVSQITTGQKLWKNPLFSTEKTINPDLIHKIETIVKSQQGTYTFYLYDINSNQNIGINEHTILTAASVNKVAILAALYHLASKDTINLEDIIVLQAQDIQDYGTGSIRYDPPGTPYSLKTLARLMMEKSDNTASYILGNHIVGIEKIQQLIDSWELTQTSMKDNKTSTKDMATLLIKMYRGEIANKPLTAEMLGFMSKSDFDDRIPKELPSGIKVYHKTGDEIGKIHDVGIVDFPQQPYYIGILTSDITDELNAKKIIAQVSKVVYDFMKKS